MHPLPFFLPRLAVLSATWLLSTAGTWAAAPNTLTPQEQAAGWRLLFDGRSTAGWHTYGKKSVTAGSWQIQDGCLVIPKGNGRPNGTGGDLVTNVLYTNFEFEFEWRVGPGGNSGVEYLFTEGEKRTASFYAGDKGDSPLGFEYQVLDDAPHASNAADRLAASIYSLVTPAGKTLRPVGEFNQGRIVVDGNHVEHWLNGRKVAECELGSPAMERIIATSKYQHYAGVGVKRATPIALAGSRCRGGLPQSQAARAAPLRRRRPHRHATCGSPAPICEICEIGGCTRFTHQPHAGRRLARLVLVQDGQPLDRAPAGQDDRADPERRAHRPQHDERWLATCHPPVPPRAPRRRLHRRRRLRGQIESFDLQSADGANQRLSCLKAPQDQQWHSLLLSRKHGKQTAWVGDAPAPLQTDKAPADMKGYFCFKLRPGETVEVRNVRVQQGR